MASKRHLLFIFILWQPRRVVASLRFFFVFVIPRLAIFSNQYPTGNSRCFPSFSCTTYVAYKRFATKPDCGERLLEVASTKEAGSVAINVAHYTTATGSMCSWCVVECSYVVVRSRTRPPSVLVAQITLNFRRLLLFVCGG